MSATAPILDSRTFDEIVQQLMVAAQRRGLPWPRLAVGAERVETADDTRQALTAVFAHYMEILLERLNQTPTKNLLAFLDLIGVGRLPPGTARAPLVFTLSPKAGATGFVPKGAQVATGQSEKQPAVVYETQQALNVVAARLVAAYAVDPISDRYACWNAAVCGKEQVTITPFVGNRPLDHILYLGLPAERLFFVRRPGTLKLEMKTAQLSSAASDLLLNALEWQVWQGNDWQSLTKPQLDPACHDRYLLTFAMATEPGSGEIASVALGAQRGRWLRGVLKKSLPDSGQILSNLGVTKISLCAQTTDPTAADLTIHIPPDAGANGAALIDITKPFHPLGIQPKRNDAFYIASREVFAQRGAVVHVHLKFERPGMPTPGLSGEDMILPDNEPKTLPFRLVWEYATSRGWEQLGQSGLSFECKTQNKTVAITLKEKAPSLIKLIKDQTQAWQNDGAVVFTVPDNIAAIEVAGQRNYWIRVRLDAGDFGRPAEFVLVNEEAPAQGFRKKRDTGNLQAPVLQALALSYENAEIQPTVLTRNGFDDNDLTVENQSDGGVTRPLFTQVKEEQRTFYLGFDRQLPNSAVSLYFVVPALQFVERLPSDQPVERSANAKLTWQYWDGRHWPELAVTDHTAGFQISGAVQLTGPTDMAAKPLFDPTPYYWLRVQWVPADSADARRQDDLASATIRLQGIFLNAVEAVQAITVQNEVLGSSNGRQNQVVRLAKAPVQPGQRIWVQEPERPAAAEEAVLVAEEGEDAVLDHRPGTDAQQRQWWVRWHEVGSLHRSEPRSRHYALERITGQLCFGNGIHGLIPPVGRDNILCEQYRAGGGANGNQPAGAINQLKTSIPYIAAVTNPVAADGGADTETLAAVQERGPQMLSHRNHAVTPGDFEWLARQAAGTRIARARCLPNRNRNLEYERGWITLIIVPNGTDKRLTPSSQLLREVEEYLTTRCLATLAGPPACLNVIGPGYLPVELEAEIVPVDPAQGNQARSMVVASMDAFLHPLTGGPAGDGWALGRDVFLSELYAAFEMLPGVEHVERLRFKPNVATLPLTFDLLPAKVTYPVGSTLTTADGLVRAVVVEAIAKEARLDTAMVTLFREGEQLRLGAGADTVETTIRAITGNTLQVEPFYAQTAYAVGTVVAATTSAAQSVLVSPIAQGTVVDQLMVRGFEQPDDQNGLSSVLLASPEQTISQELRLKCDEQQLKPNVAILQLTFDIPPARVNYPAGSTLTTTDQLVSAVLVEAIDCGAPLDAVMVTLFREGERICLGSAADAVETTVRAITGNTLRIEPLRAQANYGVGTLVAATTSKAKSVLTSPIAQGTLVELLPVRGFERQADQDEPLSVIIATSDPATAQALQLKTGPDKHLELGERLRVPAFYLVYAGEHTVTLK